MWVERRLRSASLNSNSDRPFVARVQPASLLLPPPYLPTLLLSAMDLKRPHSHLVTEPAQPDKKPRPSSPVTANGVARSRRSGSPTKPKLSVDEDEDEDEEMDSLTKVVEVSDRVSPALVGRAMGVVNGRRGWEGRVCQSVGGGGGKELASFNPRPSAVRLDALVGAGSSVRWQCGQVGRLVFL